MRRWPAGAVLLVAILGTAASVWTVQGDQPPNSRYSLILSLASPRPNYAPPPGALNPAVTQANIYQTICVPGWTRTIRPPLSYTSRIKRQQMRARHLPGNLVDYEENFFIPLELGGHPISLLNVWPQPLRKAQAQGRFATALNQEVCAGRMTLREAQTKVRNAAGR
jgi:hypothetical protein